MSPVENLQDVISRTRVGIDETFYEVMDQLTPEMMDEVAEAVKTGALLLMNQFLTDSFLDALIGTGAYDNMLSGNIGKKNAAGGFNMKTVSIKSRREMGILLENKFFGSTRNFDPDADITLASMANAIHTSAMQIDSELDKRYVDYLEKLLVKEIKRSKEKLFTKLRTILSNGSKLFKKIGADVKAHSVISNKLPVGNITIKFDSTDTLDEKIRIGKLEVLQKIYEKMNHLLMLSIDYANATDDSTKEALFLRGVDQFDFLDMETLSKQYFAGDSIVSIEIGDKKKIVMNNANSNKTISDTTMEIHYEIGFDFRDKINQAGKQIGMAAIIQQEQIYKIHKDLYPFFASGKADYFVKLKEHLRSRMDITRDQWIHVERR